jgi:uncharacterized protein (TIGR02147 family)
VNIDLKTPLKISTKPSDRLREIFFDRRRKNAAYSLRAFARDLGMSHPLLSKVLSGKRPLTLKQAHKIVALLAFDVDTQKDFLESVLLALPENAKLDSRLKRGLETGKRAKEIRHVDVEQFHLIANWYHLSLLDLMTTVGFKSDLNWISKRLGISKLEARVALERLQILGLIENKNGIFKKTARHLHWLPKKSNAAIRHYHQQMLSRGAQELDKTDEESFQRRSITANSIAMDAARIPEAKAFIYEFEQEFARRFTSGTPNEVFQLNLQFFQITKNEGDQK